MKRCLFGISVQIAFDRRMRETFCNSEMITSSDIVPDPVRRPLCDQAAAANGRFNRLRRSIDDRSWMSALGRHRTSTLQRWAPMPRFCKPKMMRHHERGHGQSKTLGHRETFGTVARSGRDADLTPDTLRVVPRRTWPRVVIHKKARGTEFPDKIIGDSFSQPPYFV